MLFITGPLYSGKRTFAQKLGGTCCFEVQKQAETTEDLEARICLPGICWR